MTRFGRTDAGSGMGGMSQRGGFAFRPRRLLRVATSASAVTLAALVVGVGAVRADTHTGFQLVLDCGDQGVFTVVTPTSPAAATQDVSSTGVLVAAVGNIVSASRAVPENRVMTCTFVASTGDTLTFPFLIAPTEH